MPKDPNSSHGASTKRKEKGSERQREQEDMSDMRNGDTVSRPGPRPAEALAASSPSLQRLASLALYIKDSIAQDIEEIEETHGEEMSKELQIRRLNETLETLVHTKSEETENLRREVDLLRKSEKDCKDERAKCQNMQADLQKLHDEKEAKLEAETEKRRQGHHTKAQKQIETKKAELEADNRKKNEEMERQKAELIRARDELKMRLAASEEKLEKKKKNHARLENSLEEENQKLKQELEQVKAEFLIDATPVNVLYVTLYLTRPRLRRANS